MQFHGYALATQLVCLLLVLINSSSNHLLLCTILGLDCTHF